MQLSENTITLGVGRLVDFSCRRGDMVSAAPAGPSAQEGIRAHKQLQKKRPKGSEAEFSLKALLPKIFSDYSVVLQGRVDILHPSKDLLDIPTLEEIKTTYVAPERVPESQKQLQWAQLKVYAYLYCLHLGELDRPVPEVLDLQLVWFNIKNKQAYKDKQSFDFSHLEQFTHVAVVQYCAWQRQVQTQLDITRLSAQSLAFPFEHYRSGQRQMAVSVYRSVRDKQTLMLEAPTGIGKTISSLYPAFKAMGENLLDKIVYLTAKNSGREAVLDALGKMQAGELQSSALVIKARSLSCACRTGGCERDSDGVCPYTKGFYDRLPQAREVLLEKKLMTPEILAEVGREFRLCPFDLSIKMLPWASLVVCDFNYVFDPLVGLSYFDENSDRIALLVDEAHNLGDRSRDMYSASVDRSDTLQAGRECKDQFPLLHKAAKSTARALGVWAESSGPGVSVNSVFTHEGERENLQVDAVTKAQARIVEAVSLTLENGDASLPDSSGDWLREVYRYLAIDALMASEHRLLTRVDERNATKGGFQDQELKLLCLNASEYLKLIYKKFHSVIVFSATLQPAEYFQASLGLPDNTQHMILPSPFASKQLGVFVCSKVDTRYQYRDLAIDKIVDVVWQTYQGQAGNYLVFFPSYQFMNQVAERFQEKYPQVAIILQEPSSSDEQRAEFMRAFDTANNTLGFAIMGGIYGEGIDYVGDKLIGAIIVGVGLPQMNETQGLIKESGEHRGHNGFDYAYRYPGLIRVLQAAGRVIRSEQDKGVLVLVDSRFTQSFYQRLFPSLWAQKHCRNVAELTQGINNFWQS